MHTKKNTKHICSHKTLKMPTFFSFSVLNMYLKERVTHTQANTLLYTCTHSYTARESLALDLLMVNDAHLFGQCRFGLLELALAAVVAQLVGDFAKGHCR